MKKVKQVTFGVLFTVLLAFGIFVGGGSIFMQTAARADAATDLPPAPVSERLYDQLNEQATKLYNALVQLHNDGGMAKGNGEIDLVKGGYVTESDLSAFMRGDSALSLSFLSARDAFANDYYRVFYVDFTKLNLRVGQVGGHFAAYINAGENANYFADGFTSAAQVETAIAAADEWIDGISGEIRAELDAWLKANVKDDKGNPLAAVYPQNQVVTKAHDKLIDRLEYTYPSKTTPYAAGIYGAISGKTNCVGYSTLLKGVLAAFDVPCALITGTAENAQRVIESHMWNAVQVDGKWYAVDVTWDDPMPAAKQVRTTPFRDRYLMRGMDEFNLNHFPSGVLSPGGQAFVYPAISAISYDAFMNPTITAEDKDFVVYSNRQISEDDTITLFTAIYKEMTHVQMDKEGLYPAARFWYYGAKDPQPWVPLDAYNIEGDDGKSFSVPISKRGSIQFCMTNIKATSPTFDGMDLSEDGKHVAGSLTKMFVAPYYSDYKPQPFIYKCEPALSRKIEPVKQAFTVTYDDTLIPLEGQSLGARVTSTEAVDGKVENLRAREEEIAIPGRGTRMVSVVQFDFTPSTAYQAYINTYQIELTGVVGSDSKKAPNSVPVCVSFEMSIPCPALVAAGAPNKASIIALPTMVVNPNADIFEYDGTGKPNSLDIRLVASIPRDEQKQDMVDATPDSAHIEASDVYDLSLACQNYMARLKSGAGYNLTIGLPYPKGYNYNENPNVTFKAYHYVLQEDGTYVAEELVCRIGERGLEVVVDSFSPFMIAVVPKSETQEEDKLVSVSLRTNGGDITTVKDNANAETISAAGLFAVKSGQSKTFTLITQAGFEIDKVLVNDKLITPENNTVTFAYQSMDADNELDVFYIAKTVQEKEANTGFVPIVSTLKRELQKLLIVSDPLKLNYKAGEKFDPSGMVVAQQYNDQTQTEVPNSMYALSNTGELKKSDKTVTVSLISDPTKTATVSITVESGTNPTLVIILCVVVIAVLIGGIVAALCYVRFRKTRT